MVLLVVPAVELEELEASELLEFAVELLSVVLEEASVADGASVSVSSVCASPVTMERTLMLALEPLTSSTFSP